MFPLTNTHTAHLPAWKLMAMMIMTTMTMVMAVGIISNEQTERESGWKYIGLFLPSDDGDDNDDDRNNYDDVDDDDHNDSHLCRWRGNKNMKAI